MSFPFRRHKKLHKQAYAAFDSGELAQAAEHFVDLVKRFPDDSPYHYMQGLTAKNRMDWPTALRANLCAIECADGFAEGVHWNAAFVRCSAAADAQALTELLEQHGWTAEDWTQSLRYLCLRCSYGIPRQHTADAEQAVDNSWQTERSIGIAAPVPQSAELAPLQSWASAAAGRAFSELCRQDCAPPARQDGKVWWVWHED
ncbi:hypothetical protein HMPREF9120_00781 [Neisseria sp. oral taxon 020 str. F0370]|uniref:hypothetical protein n=1 Tax=Neisseria sp. oral taxon 020 TaxID=712401 RepID=UPI0002A4001D|nr:hypothetical protein [Neisseria sp. oral taxon 020]EKY08383.1 hypothetical protein HMPREF9120_00781 [Neisseria sp. oral taxon 020 str. F0370]